MSDKKKPNKDGKTRYTKAQIEAWKRDIVYYMGKLYRVMGWGLSGPHQGKMLLRLCGWEQCYGNWGWESYNRPFPTTAWVGHGNPFVYHA